MNAREKLTWIAIFAILMVFAILAFFAPWFYEKSRADPIILRIFAVAGMIIILLELVKRLRILSSKANLNQDDASNEE